MWVFSPCFLGIVLVLSVWFGCQSCSCVNAVHVLTVFTR
nr:MAG TPA: hypothetical protein [Caudoviricetes sp.]